MPAVPTGRSTCEAAVDPGRAARRQSSLAQPALPGVLTIRFLDVGQGDAVLITAPEGQSLLYDGGRSEKRMTELLRQFGVKSLALVAASHADADHITGLIPAVQLFKPKLFLNNGIAATTQTFGKLTASVQAAGTQGLLASDRVINLGSVKITVLPPPPGMPRGDQNVNSVGLLVQYGSFQSADDRGQRDGRDGGMAEEVPGEHPRPRRRVQEHPPRREERGQRRRGCGRSARRTS